MTETGQDICAKLTTVFTEIQTTRMADVPVLNPVLSVATFGFDPHEDHHVGVLMTPWFMNLILIPLDPDNNPLASLQTGASHNHSLPGGRFEFMAAHEAALGQYLTCSLFSPMFDFADQEAAEITAKAVLDQVMTISEGSEKDEDADMRDIWQGRLPEETPPEENEDRPQPKREISRRDLFRARLSDDTQEVAS